MSANRANRKPIFVNGKAVYHVEGRVLRKRFRKNHILRIPPGLAVDVAVLDEAVAMGATHCQFSRIDTGENYLAPIDFIKRHGVAFNRGYGRQLALPLAYWSVDGMDPLKRPRAVMDAEKAAEIAERDDLPKQMGLFEVTR